MGSRPLSSAQRASAMTVLADPSPIPLAFPAVTNPPSRKYGRSFASPSSVASARMCSSSANSVSPFRVRIVTGTTSSAKRHSSQAALARIWLRYATSSEYSRVTPYRSPSSSAV